MLSVLSIGNLMGYFSPLVLRNCLNYMNHVNNRFNKTKKLTHLFYIYNILKF